MRTHVVILQDVLLAVLLAVLTTSCELFVIGSQTATATPPGRTQRSSTGVALLWTAEVQQRNLTAATELMRHSSGRPLLAIERHELTDDLDRWHAILRDTDVQVVKVDTLSTTSHRVMMQTSRKRVVTISALNEQNLWYVTAIR